MIRVGAQLSSGQDTVITMAGGARMALIGVQLSSLPAGWIFVG